MTGKNADTKNHNEITLNAIRGTNELLNETMATWGQMHLRLTRCYSDC